MSNTVRAALAEAAQSLEAIGEQAGVYDFMEGMPDVRAYARNRALVARAALAQSEAQPVAWVKDTSLIALKRDESIVLAYPHNYLIHPAVPLYASPQKPQPVLDASWEQSTLRPQQAQPAVPAYVPLTDDDIEQATSDCWRDDLKMKYAELCRAIESLVVARMRGDK